MATATPEPLPTLGVGSLLVNQADQASMAFIPAGDFVIGNALGGGDEKPVSTVNLAAFWIYQTEVTNDQYRLCVAAGNCVQPGGSYFGNPAYNDHPVVNVAFDQAQTYCRWAGGRLPTEAEWEKAARGGLESANYPWGNSQPTCTQDANNAAKFISCQPFSSAPVGSFASNGFGLYDTAGNAWEWTNTCYKKYPYDPADGRDNVEGGCSPVLRGGSWGSSADSLRVALRKAQPQGKTDEYTGFRCVVDQD